MAKTIKKDNEEVVAQPAATLTQNPYKYDPEVKQDASGDNVFVENLPARSRMTDVGDDDISFTGYGENEAEVDSNYTYKPVKEEEDDGGDEQGIGVLPEYGGKEGTTETASTQPKSSSLYDIEATAVSNAAGAKRRYDAAYDALKDEYKAMADLLKPKDRTEEQKRLRNAALAQAIGQGLAAIFGGIYANSKKGRGRVVMPEDFASKTLAKAEELREKGLLEEQNYKKLLGNLKLRGADLELKRSGEDYAAAQGEINRARQAIQNYEQEQRNRSFQKELAKENREFQAGEAKINREHQITMSDKNYQQAIALENLKNSNTSKGVFVGQSDAMIALSSQFMPKTGYKQVTKTDEDGNRYTEYVEVPITSYNKENYEAALRGAQQLYANAKALWGENVAKKALEDGSLTNIQSHLKSEGRDWQWITQNFAGRTPQAILDFFRDLNKAPKKEK